MRGQSLTVALYSLRPIAATLIGAIYTSIRPPGGQLRSAIQHFAAGVVFSVVAVDLLPDIIRVHDPVEIGWTFALGVVLMLVLRKFTAPAATAANVKLPNVPTLGPPETSGGELVAVTIDILIDGLLVGIAFAAGSKEGVLLTIALTIELLSLALVVASGLASSGQSRLRTIAIPTGMSVFLLIGAVLGVTLLKGVSEHTLAGMLSFGSAALLFLVTEELLLEAHLEPETTFTTVMFFAGFLIFVIFGVIG